MMSGESTRKLKYFMNVAHQTSLLSYAEKLKVGAVAVRDERIICTGYNGTPPGEDNTCETEHFICDDPYRRVLKTKSDVEHAERNLIYYAARKGIPLEGSILFVTHAPCIDCARAILNAGITEVFYTHDYKTTDGVDYLTRRIRVSRFD